ncbi:MAG: NAD(P)H-binding protein [Actinomycetota bacterium]|nr:NAD(P)H-binding protein [Actinomycetota bacterium]
MRIVVAGSSRFVGRRLCAALEGAGHCIVAMTRSPNTYRGAGTPVRADVHDVASLDAALAGADAAYYLVHSLDDADYRRKDAEAARTFAAAAGRAGLRRIVYLGGLGDDADELSAHLRSRCESSSCSPAAGAGHHAAGGDHRRPRRHLLGDHPAARRAPARHAYPPLGAHPHAADRGGRRRALPRRRA